MGNRHSCVVIPISVCVVCLVCVQCYRAHRAVQSNNLNYGELPGLVYLSVRYVARAVGRRPGCLYGAAGKRLHYKLSHCRLESHTLKRFCGAAGYGADYPDSEYRDIPLCFPEALCCRLMLLALTHKHFRLSPAGLVRVRQTLRTFQPIDELKKGPFTLEIQVLEYQQTDVGIEVDVRLSATSHCGSVVWESCVTLLSWRKIPSGSHQQEIQPSEGPAEEVEQVVLSIPRTTGLSWIWTFSEFSPQRLQWVPLRFFGFRSEMTAGLWMLSLCLAEIEKHKGVMVVTAPVRVSVHFGEPLLVPGKASLRFWEMAGGESSSSAGDVGFHMKQAGRDLTHAVGRIIHQSHVENQTLFPLQAPQYLIRWCSAFILSLSRGDLMKKQEKGDASIFQSSPTSSRRVEFHHDYQKVAFKMFPENGHALRNGSHSRKDPFSGWGNGQELGSDRKEEAACWAIDSSSQAHSGTEDNSTDPHETMTETSTLTFVDAHMLDDTVDNHSLTGVGMVYLKEFVLIDDDDDGDMSLREKTVHDLSVMDGRAAELVCGRMLSTSSCSLSECKEDPPLSEAIPSEEPESTNHRKHCCSCTLL